MNKKEIESLVIEFLKRRDSNSAQVIFVDKIYNMIQEEKRKVMGAK